MRPLAAFTVTIFTLAFTLPLASAAPPINDAVDQLEVEAGWAVHIGTTDGAIERTLVAHKKLIVTGLAYSDEAESAARAALAKAGLSGRAAIHRVLDDTRLPMAERSVAILVVSEPGVAEAEIRRVLRPGGQALVKDGSGWRAIQAPPPTEIEQIDDWTHFNYDATGSEASQDQLAGPIKSMRWLGGDPFQDDIIGMRFSNGVLVAFEHNSDGNIWGRGQTNVAPTGTIVARDAFSGAVLWQREGFFVRSRYAFTLDEQRVYLHVMDARHFKATKTWREPYHPNERPLIALDLHTGEDAMVYEQGLTLRTAPTNRFKDAMDDRANLMTALIHRGRLIQRAGGSVAVLDPKTGKLAWRYDPPEGELVGMIAVDGDRVIGMVGPAFSRPKMGYLGGTPIFKAKAIMGWDLATGRQLFRVEPEVLEKSPHVIRVAVQDGHIGVVSYAKYKNVGLKYEISCYRASDGQKLWAKKGPGAVMRGGHYPRPQIHHGRLWTSGAGGAIGWKLADGGDPLNRTATNFRCSTARATPNWIIASQKFTRIDSGESFFTEATRGRCDFGLFPANGMVYSSLGEQCGCNAFIRPRSAFATDRLPAEPWDGQRLLQGPAGADGATEWQLADDAWPRLLKDAKHSSWTDAKIAENPDQAWSVKLAGEAAADDPVRAEWATHVDVAGPVTPATVLGDTLIVALTHEQTIVALDPATGKQKWRKQVDGRIDSPPVQVNDTAFVGTRTGWVYALDRRTGQVRWRFLAAPHQQLIPVNGQAESAWPVYGSLLVHDGLVWAAAGMQAEIDHGIYWYGLDPATGAVRKSGRLAETSETHEKFSAPRTRAKNTILTTDGDHLVLWRSGIDPETGKQQRFGPTIKAYGPGVTGGKLTQGHTPSATKGLRFLASPLPSARWGWTRIGGGASYGGARGDLLSFHGDTAYAIGNRHGRVHVQRIDIPDWKVPAGKALSGPHAYNHKAAWKAGLNNVDGRRHPQPYSALVRTADTVLIATHQGIFRIDPEGKDGGKTPAIKAPVLVPYGMAVADGRLILTTHDGRVMGLK